MPYRSIVAGTDGSPSANAAVRQAAEVARSSGATLHLVSARAASSTPADGRRALVESRRFAASIGVDVVPHVGVGAPAAAICAVARQVAADLIVVGNLGTDGAMRRVRAPICDQVRSGAPCSVLVVDTEPYWRPVEDDTVARTGREPRLHRRWKVLITTTIAVFMAFLDLTIVNVAFPDIRATFPHTPVTDLSWVLNAYNVVFAAMLIPAGRLADRVGQRRMFFGGLWLFVGASALCGAAPTPALLVAARVVQAVGAAALIPSSLGLVLPEFEAAKRAHATSVWAAAGAVAAAAGPSIGGLLVNASSWRLAFFVNGVFALGVLPGRKLLVERRDPESSESPDILGGALLAGGVGLLALGIVKAPDWGWTSDQVIGAWGGAAALIALLLARARTHPSPVLEPELLRIRLFALTNATFFVFCIGFYALLLCNILFLTQVWGYSVLDAGFAVSPGPLLAAVAAGIGGRLAESRGPRAVAIPATLLFALACFVYSRVTVAQPDFLGHWLPASLLSGFAIGLVFSALAAASVMDLPPNRLATGIALTSCSRQIGAVLGIAGLIAIVGTPAPGEALHVFHEAYLLMGACALAAASISVAFSRRRPGETAEAAALKPRRAAVELAGMERHEVLLHGHRLVYRTAGSGPPVVLLHGLLESSTTWRRIAPVLALNHTVIAPDLLGHGESDAPEQVDYSLGGHVLCVRDLLDGLGVGRVTLLGHSIGAGIAMDFAQHYPDRVERLVLISAGGFGRELAGPLRLAAIPGSGPLLRALGARPTRALLGAAQALARLARGRAAARALIAAELTLGELADARVRGAFFKTLRSVIDHRGQKACALDRFAEIARCPTLIVWGTRDRIIPVAHAYAASDAHPGAELVLLDGIGHHPHLTQPAYVGQRVVAFTGAGAGRAAEPDAVPVALASV